MRSMCSCKGSGWLKKNDEGSHCVCAHRYMSANVANKQNETSDVSLFLDVLMFELCDVFF